jgi:hypothetical protein
MKTEIKSHPLIDGLIEMFGNWLIHRREMCELRQLDCGEFDSIARDLRMTPGDLDRFVRQGPHAADELPRLLEVLGIDEAALVRSEPAALQDMQRVCVSCERQVQCRNDLETGVSARDYKDYCLNASTMNALRSNPN